MCLLTIMVAIIKGRAPIPTLTVRYVLILYLLQVVMGVITKMMARPELPADCAFAQQLQEPMRTSTSRTTTG